MVAPHPDAVVPPAAHPLQVSLLREGVAAAIEAHSVAEVEVAWADHFGHPLGKRLPAAGFAERAAGERFGFCDATLSWDAVAEVHSGARLTDWDTGFPDLYAVPDAGTFRVLPWRPGAGQFIGDVQSSSGEAIRTAPRTVLRRVIAHLAELGYEARVGIEIECFLLGLADQQPLAGSTHCYSLEKANQLDPALTAITRGLEGYVPVEGVTGEYGPGQVEINLHHADPLTAADDGFRLKYAVRTLAREAGVGVTFMAKPLQSLSGSSMHLHLSLERDGRPAFASTDGAENRLQRTAIGSLVEHLPSIAVYGAPTVNSYKRFERGSYAPTTASWGGDNRTAAVRSLVAGPTETRFELRTPGADANPYWAVAALLAVVASGLEHGAAGEGAGETATRETATRETAIRGGGNLYGVGAPLPRTPAEAVALARADKEVVELLGEDAVFDYTLLVEQEWEAFLASVTDWERRRYLGLA